MAYSPQVLDHFHHPRHAGAIPGATAIVEVTNPVCGDVLKLWVVVRGGSIRDVGFQAAGCVPAVACGSWLAEWLEGKEAGQLPPLSAAEIGSSLGGLPPASTHAAALAVAACEELGRAIHPAA